MSESPRREQNQPLPTLVAIAVVRYKNRFLVGIRPPGVPLAGYAEFPGGKVHDGELPVAAALRECREECGLDVQAAGELFCTKHQYEHGLLKIHFFDCKPSNPQQSPLEPFRWITKQELAELQFPAANAPLIKIILANA